jgi:hypothetical protein
MELFFLGMSFIIINNLQRPSFATGIKRQRENDKRRCMFLRPCKVVASFNPPSEQIYAQRKESQQMDGKEGKGKERNKSQQHNSTARHHHPSTTNIFPSLLFTNLQVGCVANPLSGP